MAKTHMTLAEWYDKYDVLARKQGWSLFTADTNTHTVIAIQRIDDQTDAADTDEEAEKILETYIQLKSDDEAFKRIIVQAGCGCVMSLLALYLDGRPVGNASKTKHFIPKQLRQDKAIKPHKCKGIWCPHCGSNPLKKKKK